MIIIMYDTYPESQTERNVTAGTLIILSDGVSTAGGIGRL